MKRRILLSLALLAGFLCLSAQTQPPRFGWGNLDTRYKANASPALAKNIALYGWRGERVCAQALLLAPQGVRSLRIGAAPLKMGRSTIPAAALDLFYETYVMADTLAAGASISLVMGDDVFEGDSVLCADRLVRREEVSVPAGKLQPVWMRIRIPHDAAPGRYRGALIADCDGRSLTIPYSLEVSPRVLPEPEQWKFHLDLWQNPYAVARYFGVPLWSKEHFAHMRPIMEYLASAGQKVITASIFQHPWNSQTEDPFESMIGKFKGLDGRWTYDYTVFDRWVEFMMSCGIREQIDCYTVLPWHLTFEYYSAADNCTHCEKMIPGSREYEEYLLPFLRDFAAHLKAKGWFEKTCIAMDERPKALLEHAYDILHRADPDFRVEGAVNYFGPEVAQRMYDVSFSFREEPLQPQQVRDHLSRGGRITFYTCCNPQRPNTFVSSPPAESAVMGWYAAALGYSGYLRWAYNSWVKDPCKDARFRVWRAGDCFLVYPDGPSIRMERLIEGIQDFEKMGILRRGGLDPRKEALLDAQLRRFREVDWLHSSNEDVAALVAQSQALLRSLE